MSSAPSLWLIYTGLTGCALTIVAGQMLFKLSAMRLRASEGASELVTLLTFPVFWLAIAVYGAATIVWIVLLQYVPISRAYPFLALGFAVVPLLAAAFFGEALSARVLLGSGLIIAGIWLAGAAPS